MSDETTAAPGGGADGDVPSMPVTTPATPDTTPISASEAARQLAAWRYKRANPEGGDAPAAGANEGAAGAQTDTAAQADAAPPVQQEAPGETTDTGEPAAEQLPPIDPPRSWTAEDKEIFRTLPRATQENLAARDRARETEFRRGQNEAAELRKAVDAERNEVMQARARY